MCSDYRFGRIDEFYGKSVERPGSSKVTQARPDCEVQKRQHLLLEEGAEATGLRQDSRTPRACSPTFNLHRRSYVTILIFSLSLWLSLSLSLSSLVSIIRGQVLTADGTPLIGVNVTFVDYPQHGYTVTRKDGMCVIIHLNPKSFRLIDVFTSLTCSRAASARAVRPRWHFTFTKVTFL